MLALNMSTICIIPARLNSSRFPGKLLAKAFGKTVLQRTFEAARSSKRLDGLYVATDSEEIGDHIQKIGGEVLWTTSFPRDGTERISEAFGRYDFLQKAEAILNLQGDHPCSSSEAIDAVINALFSDETAAISTAATPIRNLNDFHAPQIVKCLFDQEGNALYFSRAPVPYHGPNQQLLAFHHLGIYCYRRSFLEKLPSLPVTPLQIKEDLEQLRFLEWGYRMKIALVKEVSLGVDTPEDLIKLEEYLCQKNR